MPPTSSPPPSAAAGGAPAAFLTQVAQVATERAGAWDAFTCVLGGPHRLAVDGLRSGELTAAWRAGVRWLGTDTAMFTAALMSLEVYARGARRRAPEADLAAFEADHAALVVPRSATLAHLPDVAALCREEAAAWAAGNLTLGKELRAQQHALVEEHLVPSLPELGETLASRATSDVCRVLGRLLLAFVTTETGRDYQRAAQDTSRHTYLDPL